MCTLYAYTIKRPCLSLFLCTTMSCIFLCLIQPIVMLWHVVVQCEQLHSVCLVFTSFPHIFNKLSLLLWSYSALRCLKCYFCLKLEHLSTSLGQTWINIPQILCTSMYCTSMSQLENSTAHNAPWKQLIKHSQINYPLLCPTYLEAFPFLKSLLSHKWAFYRTFYVLNTDKMWI